MNARVLVVDDDPWILRMVTATLQKRGYVVDTAREGREALERAHNYPPDVVISDVMMPVMDGWTFAQQMRSVPHLLSIPVVFLTALGKDEPRLRALGLGPEDYLAKPFRFEELERRVASALSRRRGPVGDAHHPPASPSQRGPGGYDAHPGYANNGYPGYPPSPYGQPGQPNYPQGRPQNQQPPSGHGGPGGQPSAAPNFGANGQPGYPSNGQPGYPGGYPQPGYSNNGYPYGGHPYPGYPPGYPAAAPHYANGYEQPSPAPQAPQAPPATPHPAGGPPTNPRRATALNGRLEQLQLSSLLVMMEMERKDGVLTLKDVDVGHVGRIFLRGGQVVCARIDARPEHPGRDCVYEMLRWTAGSFSFSATEVDMEDTVQSSTTHLLMEGARLIDEGARGIDDDDDVF